MPAYQPSSGRYPAHIPLDNQPPSLQNVREQPKHEDREEDHSPSSSCSTVGGVRCAHHLSQARPTSSKVTTAVVTRQDLTSVVSGTGQIKPKTYVNIGATAFGRITNLNVKEGDHVRKGAVLATLENVQPSATVAAQTATIASSRTDVNSFLAAEATAKANIAAAKADLEQKKLDYDPRSGPLQRQAHRQAGLSTRRRLPTTPTWQPSRSARPPLISRPRLRPPRSAPTSTRPVASQRSNFDALDKTV